MSHKRAYQLQMTVHVWFWSLHDSIALREPGQDSEVCLCKTIRVAGTYGSYGSTPGSSAVSLTIIGECKVNGGRSPHKSNAPDNTTSGTVRTGLHITSSLRSWSSPTIRRYVLGLFVLFANVSRLASASHIDGSPSRMQRNLWPSKKQVDLFERQIARLWIEQVDER